MTAAETYTYDDVPPRRPSLDDLGGSDYENDPYNPPDRRTMPNAEAMNEQARNLAGLNRVCPVAVIHVTFTVGVPAILSVSGARSAISASDFTVTDNGTGDTSITWATSVLPASTMPPVVSIAEDIEIDRARAYIVTGGVRVKTKLGATATNCAFIVVVY